MRESLFSKRNLRAFGAIILALTLATGLVIGSATTPEPRQLSGVTDLPTQAVHTFVGEKPLYLPTLYVPLGSGPHEAATNSLVQVVRYEAQQQEPDELATSVRHEARRQVLQEHQDSSRERIQATREDAMPRNRRFDPRAVPISGT